MEYQVQGVVSLMITISIALLVVLFCRAIVQWWLGVSDVIKELKILNKTIKESKVN